MRKIYNKDLTTDLIERNQKIAIEAEKLKKLDITTLRISPAKGKWSILQCFGHMNIVYEIYLRNIQYSLEKSKAKHVPSSGFYIPGYFGNKFYLTMLPAKAGKKKKSMKTLKKFVPEMNEKAIDDFLSHHSIFTELIRLIPGQNLGKTKAASAIGRIIRFKLGDIYRIITAHNERHIIQAKNTAELLSKSTDRLHLTS